MAEENKMKIRVRFAGGEEFEAEGSQNFVEQQRNYFLSLLGKTVPGKMSAAQPVNTATPIDFYEKPSEISSGTRSIVRENIISPTRMWERIIREDGVRVYLRQKFKITVQEAACLLIAGARVLLKKPSYSALELSKSIQSSGFALPNRMDRLLAGELENGILISEGSKRSRTYQLSDQGFAKSFILAEKLVNK